MHHERALVIDGETDLRGKPPLGFLAAAADISKLQLD